MYYSKTLFALYSIKGGPLFLNTQIFEYLLVNVKMIRPHLNTFVNFLVDSSLVLLLEVLCHFLLYDALVSLLFEYVVLILFLFSNALETILFFYDFEIVSLLSLLIDNEKILVFNGVCNPLLFLFTQFFVTDMFCSHHGIDGLFFQFSVSFHFIDCMILVR